MNEIKEIERDFPIAGPFYKKGDGIDTRCQGSVLDFDSQVEADTKYYLSRIARRGAIRPHPDSWN